jgi:hypothetical protein
LAFGLGSLVFVATTKVSDQSPKAKDLKPKTKVFMKLLSISLGSWLLALLLFLLAFSVIEGQSFNSATVISLILTALLFSLAYAPSLSWLRKRMGGCRPALLFPLASAIVLNIPVFLIEILAIGRTLAPSEAFFCIGAFLLMGTVFGLGFVWNYQDTAL